MNPATVIPTPPNGIPAESQPSCATTTPTMPSTQSPVYRKFLIKFLLKLSYKKKYLSELQEELFLSLSNAMLLIVMDKELLVSLKVMAQSLSI